MEVPMAPAFKGYNNNGSWKNKRLYETKVSRQAEARGDLRTDRGGLLHFEGAPALESGSGGRKTYSGHSNNSWEALASPRLVGRSLPEDVRIENGLEIPESSEDSETSQDENVGDSENSGGEDDASLIPGGGAAEAPQKWPIIQIVEPPQWLPNGWTAVLRTRESGSKDKYYVDPLTQRRFRSKTEVNYFLQTGKSYRYKRNLALLTQPLKEDPVSLPNSIGIRNPGIEVSAGRDAAMTLPFMSSSSSVRGSEQKGLSAGQGRSGVAPGAFLIQGDPSRKPYNKPGPKPGLKPGPKPKMKSIPDEGGKQMIGNPLKKSVMNPKTMDDLQSTENRGKLILKLKRRTAELDEAQRDGKKARPFEVVGTTPMSHAKSLSTSSDEDGMHARNPWAAFDHPPEGSSRGAVAHSVVPTLVNVLPRRKTPEWLMHSRAPTLNRAFAVGGPQTSGGNGQIQPVEQISGSNPASVDGESVKLSGKRESPAEQLQRLGRKLCLQAVSALRYEHLSMNSMHQVNLALHDAPATRHTNGIYGPQFNRTFNPSFSAGSHFLGAQPLGSVSMPAMPAMAAYQDQHSKRPRGSMSKGCLLSL